MMAIDGDAWNAEIKLIMAMAKGQRRRWHLALWEGAVHCDCLSHVHIPGRSAGATSFPFERSLGTSAALGHSDGLVACPLRQTHDSFTCPRHHLSCNLQSLLFQLYTSLLSSIRPSPARNMLSGSIRTSIVTAKPILLGRPHLRFISRPCIAYTRPLCQPHRNKLQNKQNMTTPIPCRHGI